MSSAINDKYSSRYDKTLNDYLNHFKSTDDDSNLNDYYMSLVNEIVDINSWILVYFEGNYDMYIIYNYPSLAGATGGSGVFINCHVILDK